MFQLKTISEKYLIPRREGWEEVLEPLVRKITGAQQGKCREACNHENETFKIKTHKFGICHCDYGKQYKNFSEVNQHSPECFHTQWAEIQDAFRKHPKYGSALILQTERVNMETQLCRKYRIPYGGGLSLENVCTCPFDIKWKALDVQHQEDCEHVAPNFFHKESDYKIWWKKKFFRDSYANQRIDLNEFKKIIKECIKSV